jgi:hypothetical protein
MERSRAEEVRGLVGAVTLEALDLSLDPLTGKLQEEMLLLY